MLCMCIYTVSAGALVRAMIASRKMKVTRNACSCKRTCKSSVNKTEIIIITYHLLCVAPLSVVVIIVLLGVGACSCTVTWMGMQVCTCGSMSHMGAVDT